MDTTSAPQNRSALKRRRSILLASAFALGLSGVLAGEALMVGSHPALAQTTTSAPPPVQAQMMSFADMVANVKPAVVSVRVKTEEKAGAQQTAQGLPFFFRDLPPDSPLRRFFGDQFGQNQDQDDDSDSRSGSGQNNNRRDTPKHFAMAQGSGFFISADGYAVTNNHVVENATEVEIATDDGKTYKAKVIGADPRTDLAVIKVDGDREFPFVKFATTMPRVGDWAVAIGNPFGLGGSVTAGIVSARGREIGAGPYDDFLQIDAPVNRGNSGGPTFNLNGDVVGVNTAIYSPSGGNVGIAFAIPSEVATNVIAELKDHGNVTRGWLGIQIQPVTDDIADSIGLKQAKGAMVVEPQSGTPAEKAGIRAGDVITAVNGEPVADPRELSRRIAGMAPGANADLTVFRSGQEQKIAVPLGKLPEDQKQARAGGNDDRGSPPSAQTNLADLGIRVQPASRANGGSDEGVVVTSVDASSDIAQKLSRGDVILEVGGKKVASAGDIRDAVKSARDKGTKSVLLRIKSGGGTRYVAIPVARG